MPAVTVNDLASLSILSRPEPSHHARPVWSVTRARDGFEGEGFPVRRGFFGVDLRLLDPFVLLDQMGEVDYAPGEPKGTSWHPHRGFETVTYMIDGEIVHHDSTGGGGVIANGDTQWMTAGAGILHIERPPERLVRSGGLFHGVQLWVNLPAAHKFTPPRYQDIPADRVALAATDDGGALVRIIAGEIDGLRGPGVTHTPISLAHATLAPGARLALKWPRHHNALVYVLSGRGTVGPGRRPIQQGQLALLGEGDIIQLDADARQRGVDALDALVLGGEPIGEPVIHFGPFVMNSEREIRQAIRDYHSGRMGVIPASAA